MEHDAARAALHGDFSLEPLEIIAPAALQGLAIPERRWIWPEWIPVGAVTALYGDGGTGKSLLAQQLMTACATGAPKIATTASPMYLSTVPPQAFTAAVISPR